MKFKKIKAKKQCDFCFRQARFIDINSHGYNEKGFFIPRFVNVCSECNQNELERFLKVEVWQ